MITKLKLPLLMFLVGLIGCWPIKGQVGPAGGTSANPTYYIPYVTHIPHATTCVDGDGSTKTGNERPDYDTLVGIVNNTSAQVTGRFTVYNQSGVIQQWSGSNYKDIILDPGHAVATTFIPNNVYADAPNNFEGYGVIESTTGAKLDVFAMLGGAGCYPNHWNTFSAEVPVIPNIGRKVTSGFGYLIPYFDDGSSGMNHTGANAYRTKMVLTNFDVIDVVFHIVYTIGDYYPDAGDSFTFDVAVNANHSVGFDVYTYLTTLAAPLYVAGTNSEGGLMVTTNNSNGSPVAAKTASYVLVTNRDVNNFSSGYGR